MAVKGSRSELIKCLINDVKPHSMDKLEDQKHGTSHNYDVFYEKFITILQLNIKITLQM